MTLEARKIEFVQEFLKLKSEDSVARLEKILKKEKVNSTDHEYQPMSKVDFNKRIDQSESDFENGRFKSSSDVLSKYD